MSERAPWLVALPSARRPMSLGGAAAALVHSRLGQLRDGQLTIRDPWGAATFGRPGDLSATVDVHSSSVYRRVLTGGTLAAARGYTRGDWTADDLTAVCRIFARNGHLIDAFEGGWARLARPWHRLVHLVRRNSRRGSRRNIHAHYDLGNDFFRLFLDETMSYSSAIFPTPGASLHDASVHKMERVCRELRLSPADHLLEIGSGWGGLAIHAASRYGCRVTTTTVSREQHALATARVREAGLADRVTVLLSDYRDLSGTYDALVSIEMIEAVGHAYLDAYFARCGRLLRPGGRMLLQAITVPDDRYDAHRRSVDFIQQDVFPGSCIPSMRAMQDAMARTSRLRVIDVHDITPHYAETLRRWQAAFLARRDDVAALGLPEAFIRLWTFYLCYTEAGFEERTIGDVQVLIEHAA